MPYVLHGALPTQSDAAGLHLADALYFAVHTHLYAVADGRVSLHASVEGTITHVAMRGRQALLATPERVFLLDGAAVVGSLKRAATALAADERVFAIGVGNALEVWALPRTHRFALFRRVFRGVGHARPITSITLLSSTAALTTSADGTVRLFEWGRPGATRAARRGATRVLAKARGTPAGAHAHGDEVAVPSTDGRIAFFRADRTDRTDERVIDLAMPILASAVAGPCLAVLADPRAAAATAEQRERMAEMRQPEEDYFHSLVARSAGTAPRTAPTAAPPATLLVIYRAGAEVFRAALSERATQVVLAGDGARVGLRGPAFAGVYAVATEALTCALDLPRIVGFSLSDRGRVVAACADGRVRLYDGLACRAVLHDARAQGALLAAHCAGNVCVAVTRRGHVSVFNAEHATCYRSFAVDAAHGDFLHSAIADDGCLLFLADTARIAVVELQRSRLLDEVLLEAPLVALRHYRASLYFIDLAQRLVRLNPCTGARTALALEHVATALSVGAGRVAVAAGGEVVVYDADLNYLSSSDVALEARHRAEEHSRPKPVEVLAHTHEHVVCGGRANELRVLLQDRSGACPLRTGAAQTLRLSAHSDWENFKRRLGHERDGVFDRARFIEARHIEAAAGRVYVLSREGVSIFGEPRLAVAPLVLPAEVTPAFVAAAAARGDHGAALAGALLLGDDAAVRCAIAAGADTRALVHCVPRPLAPLLVRAVLRALRADGADMRLVEVLRWCAVLHGAVARDAIDDVRRIAQGAGRAIGECRYLLRALGAAEGAQT